METKQLAKSARKEADNPTCLNSDNIEINISIFVVNAADKFIRNGSLFVLIQPNSKLSL